MFEITADDIALLNDEDLRSLVGLLCEAETRSRGIPTSSVTWGGHQNAADAGLDVRVALPPNTVIDGFVPRPATGFQVKKPDMPRAAILAEMCPRPDRKSPGVLKPVIRELADQGGAYIIVSSTGSTSDLALNNRRKAMAEAVSGLANASALHLDFYDRARLATWVRGHAGLIPWVRERVGKAIQGWRPYGAWAYAPEGITGEYLLDDGLRIQTGKKESEAGFQALAGIEQIRDRLRQPGRIVRLVGLSGVGKTRLVQALFDQRIGRNHLDPSLAIYTNMAYAPDPQPTGLASDLIAKQTSAILVIDNCPPDLHRRLAEVCQTPGSAVSVITVEYDIREDQPEGTDVFKLEPSSSELVEKVVWHRFPELSGVDARTIADFSGGNARIAIALAGTVGKNETVAGLTDEDLFQRLFRQRHEHDESVYLAALACSLVYSFQAEDIPQGDSAELGRLGAIVGMDAQALHRAVAELFNRDLVQRRGVWRAVLPHAIANRLAAKALQAIPHGAIEAQLVTNVPERLLQSYSRRLGYLHTNENAVTIVTKWLSVGGLLEDVAGHNAVHKAMFNNVAPAAPAAALAALERAILSASCDDDILNCSDYVRLLRSLAYDAISFERSAALILKLAKAGVAGGRSNEPANIFNSLFHLYLSGTHAKIEQRLGVIDQLLHSDDASLNSFGFSALKAALEAWHFGPSYSFDFGARSRDYGYWPGNDGEVKTWFSSVLGFTEKLAAGDGEMPAQVRAALADKFRGLWTMAGMHDELERVCRSIIERHFWPEGWVAVRQTQRFDGEGFTPNVSAQLASLEEALRPVGLVAKVRSIVLSSKLTGVDFDLEDGDEGETEPAGKKLERIVQRLGESVATDKKVFEELLGELLSRQGHLWHFGRGLATAAEDAREIWNQLVSQWAATALDQRNVQVLRGFLEGLNSSSPQLANALLDEALEDKTLGPLFPVLQTALAIDQHGTDRLKRSLTLGMADSWAYHSLIFGGVTGSIQGPDLRELVVGIAGKADGFYVAIEILYMRFHFDKDRKQEHAPEALAAGRELISQVTFARNNNHEDYRLAKIAKYCLAGEGGSTIARESVRKLKASVATFETNAYQYDDFLDALCRVQSAATLDSLFSGDATELKSGIRMINEIRNLKKNPLEGVPEDDLLQWCDQYPNTRYPAISACVRFSQSTDKTAPRQWTKLALRLIDKAPDRVEVLSTFTRQFRPMSWSGSRATIMESNLRLLDELTIYPEAAFVEFVSKEKVRLGQDIDAERRRETITDREKDERFE